MQNLWRAVTFCFAGVSLSVAADILLKKSVSGSWAQFFLGFGLYACAAIPVTLAYRFTTFGRVFLLWEAINVVLCILTAKFIFKEGFGFREISALIFIAAAIFLLKGKA